MMVQALGKGFGQTVGQRLQQYVVIIVMACLEAGEMLLDAMARRHREAADPVVLGRDEVGEAHIGAALPLGDLLAQEGHAHFTLIGLDQHVVALAAAGPERGDAARGQPFLGDDGVEHRLRILEEVARALSDDRIVEDRGVIARQFPGAEERRPVDIVAQVGQIPVGIDVDAGLGRGGGLERRVDHEAVGAGILDGDERAVPLIGAGLADMFIIPRRLADEPVLLGVADQRRRHAHRAAGVEHMDNRPFISGVDAQRGVDPGCRGAADQQRQVKTRALHFLGHRHHLVERGGDEAGQADHVRLIFIGGLQYLGPGHHNAEVDHLETVALEHDSDNILADIVYVALHGRHHDPALALGILVLLRLDEGEEVSDGLLHHAGGLDDLRQEHLARAEQVADDIHSLHQRAFDHLDRASAPRRDFEAHFLGVGDDMGVDAFDQRMFQPLDDRPAAPFLGGLFSSGVLALELLGQLHQPLSRARIAVEDHILARLAQVRVDGVIDVELPRIDDGHVHARRYRVIEEHRVHRAAHRLIAAKAEGEVGKAARNMHMRATALDLPRRLNEVDRIIVMILDAGRDREHIGVEDDVLGRKADFHQQRVGALANLDLARLRVGLSDLVERHHHHGGAIGHAFARLLQKLLDAFLHADRIDDRLAGHAFEARLDDAPFGTVDHHRHAGDVGFGGDELQELDHRRFGIEQALVHVHIDDLRAVLDLLPGDLHRCGIVARHYELLELGRASDVGALADIDKGGGGLGGGHVSFLMKCYRRSGGQGRGRRKSARRR